MIRSFVESRPDASETSAIETVIAALRDAPGARAHILHLSDAQYDAFWQEVQDLHARYAALQDPAAPRRATESVALTLPDPENV